jgi:PPOX class probable F420-dependent enzyme
MLDGRPRSYDTASMTGDNPAMTSFPESHRDLLDNEVASLATIDGEGFPQISEVWFLLDDDELRISLNDSRYKTKNLMERPQCSLLLLDLAIPDRYLEVRCRARIEPDDADAFAQKVGAKYGADLKQHDGPGDRRVVVTIEPVKLHAVDMRG